MYTDITNWWNTTGNFINFILYQDVHVIKSFGTIIIIYYDKKKVEKIFVLYNKLFYNVDIYSMDEIIEITNVGLVLLWY